MASRPMASAPSATAPSATVPSASAPIAPAPSARAWIRATDGGVSEVMPRTPRLDELRRVEPVRQYAARLDQIVRSACQERAGARLRLHLAVAHRHAATFHGGHRPA